jgi:mono/diheme cytochrome c family protein
VLLIAQRLFIFALAGLFACGSVQAAELNAAQKAKTMKVAEAVKDTRAKYQAGDYEAAGKSLIAAMDAVDAAVQESDPVLFDAIAPAFPLIAKAQTLLELEGVVLRPFAVPARPTAVANKPTPTKPVKPVRPVVKKPVPEPEMKPAEPANPLAAAVPSISFVKTVAPILVQQCGRCHVSGSRGNFNMATFAALQKGPPEGVVIFPGDVIGSRLIETIVSGDMPRGGSMPPGDLKILKDWIAAGAKYDGPSPDTPIASFVSATPGAPDPMPAPMPVIKRATGTETVSFAKDIAPILLKNCNGCHVDAMQVRGNLNMTTFAGLLRGGDSGVAVEGGKSMTSLLVRKLKGEEGDRMPAGGRPPLSDEQITLISKWIDEGASLDGDSEDQPLGTMSALAWAKSATDEELSERRASIAMNSLKLGLGALPRSEGLASDQFYVVGDVGEGTLKVVSDAATKAWSEIEPWVKTDSVRGRITIFVLPKRYEYSEFSKMVEQRSIPSDWLSHWKYDGIDAYVAMVATSDDEDDTIKARLVSPLASLAAAMRGPAIPRWFSEGVGRASAAKIAARDLPAVDGWNRDLPSAVASMKDGPQFIKNELPPEQSDLIAYGIASVMLSRQQRTRYDKLIRTLPTSKSFDAAFEEAFGANVATYVSQYKQLSGTAMPRRSR